MKNQIMIGLVAVGLITGCASNENRDSVRHEGAGAETTPSLGTSFDELPAAVQATVKAQAPNAKIDDIDKEMRTGRTVYEVKFKDEGINPAIHVAEDGTLLKADDGKLGDGKGSSNASVGAVETGAAQSSANVQAPVNEAAGAATGPKVGTKLSDLPDAVQKTISSRAPNAKIDDIDKETRSGRVVYEVQFEEPGQNPKLHIAEDGTVVNE